MTISVKRRRRDWVRFLALDVGAWALALLLATLFRFEFVMDAAHWTGLTAIFILVVTVQLVSGYLLGLYRGRYGYGTFDEVRGLTILVLGVSAVVTAVLLIVGPAWQVPRSTMVVAGPVALVTMLGLRYVHRLRRESRFGPGDNAAPTLIYGAGMLGESLARRMQIDSHSSYRPVGFLDDDRSLQRRLVRGVPVAGTLRDLPKAVERTGATELIVAISDADNHLIRDVADVAAPTGVNVRVLPVLDRQLTDAVGLQDLRSLSIEDLIGREPVDTAVDTAAEYLSGKRVLVTGAGGSIGSELCQQIIKYSPAELIMLDRDETALQDAQLGTVGHGLLDTKDVVLADIRDAEALKQVFAERRPHVVYHAAALKHLPMLEQYPEEAWKSNVLGTLNVLEAARAADVDVFINISTDKAANPTSMLGHSKRVAEKLTAWMAGQTQKPYLSVRFGNVIGSRGSMLPTFRRLIEQGGPVTVTHPDVTRYFMTIPEASHLVIQAGAIGRPGEVMILDMGEPVNILGIAQRMIEMSGKDVPLVFTGLRHGEKLHEELIGEGETDNRPFHPKISHADVSTLGPDALDYAEWLQRAQGTQPVHDGASTGNAA
ncbi:nucleoside-diphosphate sugar epimerase/dehydratase [Micrococcus sp. 2A]|uniref:polysaccharide biosynthesis protein n=1 Tax=unclassified Micrococcus TaxID=2620948 RepID=UPI00200326E9